MIIIKCSVYKLSNYNKYFVVLLQMWVGYACFFLLYQWRLIFLTNSGQGLMNAMKKSKKCFEDFLIKSETKAFHTQSVSILMNRCQFHQHFTSGSETKSFHTQSVSILMNRCQFHQHFTNGFFIQKCFMQLFCPYSLGL